MPVPFIRPSLPAEQQGLNMLPVSSFFPCKQSLFEQRGIKQYIEVWYHGIAAEKVQQKCTLYHGYDIKGQYTMVNTNTRPPEGSYHKPFQSRRMGFVGFSEMYLYLFTVGSQCN